MSDHNITNITNYITNHQPILLTISYHCDMKTLLSLMVVNKKWYEVVKYVINTAPTVFISMYSIDTNGVVPNKFIYKSLKELYTELHQYRLNNPSQLANPMIAYEEDNHAGPCSECLKYPDPDYYYCTCGDRQYLGIKMVKYISPEADDTKQNIIDSYYIARQWDSQLYPLPITAKGFRMSTMIEYIHDYHYHVKESINYESMVYLYSGKRELQRKIKLRLKYGIKMWNPDKWKYCNMYYPATTDLLDCLHFGYFGYLPDGKADFKSHHGLSFIEPKSIQKLDHNTI